MPKYLASAEPFFFPCHRFDSVNAISTPYAVENRPIPLFQISPSLSQTSSHADKITKPKRAAISLLSRVFTEISSR